MTKDIESLKKRRDQIDALIKQKEARKKDTTKEIEDLKKAQWYINREIKRLEVLEK